MSQTDLQAVAEHRDDEHHEEEVEESLDRIEKTSQRLPLLLFLATFLGSILGLAADLSDASGLVIPVLNLLDPVPALRIVGSSTVLGDGVDMASEWQQVFEAQRQREVNVVVDRVSRAPNISIEAVGSVRGCQEAAAGEPVNLLATSEPLPNAPGCEEGLANAGVIIACAAPIGYDVIVFVTDINNTLPPINRRDMNSILSGSLRDWAQVEGVTGDSRPIRVLARRGSGTTDTVLQNFTGSTDYPDHFIECDGNEGCLNQVLATPGSLYWVSAAWLQTQPSEYLRLVLLDTGGTAPQNSLQDGFDPELYPAELVRPLYMFVLESEQVDAESTQLARNFLQFVRGIEGQQILAGHNFYTYFDPPTGVPINLPGEFGTVGPNGLALVCQP